MPPCQRADALGLGVPQELCGAALQPMMAQLRRDMQHWKPRSITPAMLDEIRAAKPDDPVRVALMIVNRTVWYQRPLGTPRSPMVIALVHDLQELADSHPVPDVEFVLNVDDYPFINRRRRRRASPPPRPPLPLFSHYQTTAHADVLCPGGSFREGRFDQLMLCGAPYYSSRWPWRRKRNAGFWRGHPYCGRHLYGRCSRYLLPHLSAQNASSLLDAGLSFYEAHLDPYLKQRKSAGCPQTMGPRLCWAEAKEGRGGKGRGARQRLARCASASACHEDLPKAAFPLGASKWVPIDAHPRYRFLLQLDGHTCSWRLQFLLATNSVVLKQESFYWEYYYAALAPHVHYLPFWQQSAHDILGVLPNVSAPQHAAAMRKVGRHGSAFAHRYLNAHARQCYWRALLLLYAHRLQEPPSLARWPEAQKARGNLREGWHAGGTARAAPRVRWGGIGPGWRRRDEVSVREAVRRVEEELAAASPEQSFTTAVERRSPVF